MCRNTLALTSPLLTVPFARRLLVPMDKLSRQEVAQTYTKYGGLMLRRCRVILRDDALADDAFQNAFVKLIRHGRAFREADRKVPWLYRLCANCCFDLLAKRKRTDERHRASPDPVRLHPAIDAEQRDAALRVLGQLDDKERRIAVMAFVDGASKREIGEELGWSRQTVHAKLKTIREKAIRRIGGERR